MTRPPENPENPSTSDVIPRAEVARVTVVGAASPASFPLPNKVYFRIGEVAELLAVEPHVVRFWQEQFAAVRPERSSTGRFLYSRAAVGRLQRIRHLLYDQGYTIAGARKVLQEGATAPQGPPAVAPARPAPASEDRRVAELQAEVDRLQHDLRAIQARLAATEQAERQARHAADGVDARVRAELHAAIAELDALTSAVTGDR